MHRFRPALAVTAALTLTTVAAAPAFAASTAQPAHGAATSGLQLLHLELGGHAVSAGEIAAVANNAASPHVAQLLVTPAAFDGTTYGQQKVTPANSPLTVPSGAQTATLPGGLGSLTGPTFAVTATDGTTVVTSAVLKALGAVNVATLPVTLNATAAQLTDTAQVSSVQSSGEKSVVLGNLSLPSVGDLLNALNIDPESLYLSLTQAALNTLNELVGAAPLTAVNAAVDAAQTAVSSAQTAVGAGGVVPQSELATEAAATAAEAAATTAAADDTAANAAFTAALSAIAVLPSGVTTALTPTQYQQLDTVTKAALDALNSNLASLATTAITADGVKAAADALVSSLNDLADALFELAVSVFENVDSITTPIASLGNINVTTKAVASSNSPAPVATAKVGSVSILGVVTPPAELTSALTGVLTQLAGVLNSVAGISFTPPSVAVGVGHTARSISGTTHNATASITGVTVTLPKLTLPTSFLNLNLQPAAAKARFVKRGVRAGTPKAAIDTTVVTSGGTLRIATLSEATSYTPAVTAGSPSNGRTPGSLASTGSTYAVPALAALMLLAGLTVVRRRRATAVETD